MKIKVPKVEVNAAGKEKQWRKATEFFGDYMDQCEKAGVSHAMVLQTTADCLAHLLVRHSNNTQAIMSVMGATIAKHEGLRRDELKKKRTGSK